MHKPIDEEMGNQMVATMLFLDSESREDISMYINCSGGDVRPHERCRICISTSRGMALGLLAVAQGMGKLYIELLQQLLMPYSFGDN